MRALLRGVPPMSSQSEIAELISYLTEGERQQIAHFAGLSAWAPLDGPQRDAYECEADVIGYGGAAGGGKTDLALGKALFQHRRSAIFRREGTELTAIVDRLAELLGSRDGYNGQEKIFRVPGKRQVEFGSLANPGDERKYQGRPKDLLVIDEAANCLEAPVRYLMGWVRTTVKGQHCQTLMTFNPPTSAEGQWIIKFFAPWLDRKHPKPAKPGELRWFATVNGEDIEVETNEPFVILGDRPEYDFDPLAYPVDQIITPLSRTFIPSRVTDNPHLAGTHYMAQLQALPEPLRSQMLYGDFTAGMEDDAMQVIPSAWVDAAMRRWSEPVQRAPMTTLGVDVARGGKDNTVIARRHGMWFDQPLAYPGAQTPDGPSCAGLVIAAMRDGAPIHIDVIGVGSAPYDFLRSANQQIVGVNVAEKSLATDRSGRLRFANQRSELWWAMREALDPSHNTGITLPPDERLRADLCAPTWELRGPVVYVESRDEIHKRIGRSPDWASAYILALIDTPKRTQLPGRAGRSNPLEHNPYDNLR